jgi:plasmid stabilization system protein ParE
VIIVWRAIAEEQLRQQLDFLSKKSAQAALRAEARIEQRVSRLLHAPHTGRPTTRESAREFVISRTPFVAVYRVEVGQIVILRFFHAAQDR